MSFCTFGVAVAVSAMIGAFPISFMMGRILLYSGLKSCPHSEIQWLHQLHKKKFKSFKEINIFCFVSDSGATYNNLVTCATRSDLTFSI